MHSEIPLTQENAKKLGFDKIDDPQANGLPGFQCASFSDKRHYRD